jgi:hypothetical protein
MPADGNATMHDATPGAVNRKKQKRREKEAAKKAAQDPPAPAPAPATARNGLPAAQGQHYADPELDDPAYDAYDYSDEDDDDHHHHDDVYTRNGYYDQGFGHVPVRTASGKKPRRKKKAPPASAPPPLGYTSQQPAARHAPAPAHSRDVVHAGPKKDRIWNTTTAEERERIREFWLSLGEDERKSLVKIEKEAVLRKMKEQQKHSCSCTVCGRKRTAIEEELEVLYDAYYEELEQYAHHQQDVGSFIPEANYGYASSAPHPRPMLNTHPPPGAYDDDEEGYDSAEEEEEDSDYNSEISSEADYSSEERSLPPPEAADFLTFGSSLQVKGMHTAISMVGAC